MASYAEFYEKQGRFPEDAAEFTGWLGLEDAGFLRSFNPLSTLAAHFWEAYFDRALEACREDPSFSSYSAREIYLSLLYNLTRILQENPTMNRDMVHFGKALPSAPRELRLLKRPAEAFIGELLEAGKQSGEIADRPLVSFQYAKWCWWGLLFIIYFWKHDTSEQGESTDVAIEKVAHLIFDMLNPNAVDSSIEFFTFLFKQRFK